MKLKTLALIAVCAIVIVYAPHLHAQSLPGVAGPMYPVTPWEPIGGLPQCGADYGIDTVWAWVKQHIFWGFGQ